MVLRLAFSAVLLTLLLAAASCGSSTTTLSGTTTRPAAATTTAPTTTTTAPPSSPAGALTAEAQSAAAGDIPDNQVFLDFRNAVGYSIKYPEGWLQHGSGRNVTFQDKDNRIRIVERHGPSFSAASVRADLAALRSANASFRASSPTSTALPGGAAFKVTYSTESQPNPVTNKRVTLAVDRYYLSKAGRQAIVDLGAPKGVDNVDAFRLMIESFRWR